MIKQLSIFGFLMLLIGLSQPTVQAQTLRIGIVDPSTILQRMPEMRAVEQRYQNLENRLIQQLQTEQQELQSAFDTYQQRAGVISEEVRQREEEQLTQMQAAFQQSQADVQQQLQDQQMEMMSPLLQQIQDAINQVAEEQNLDLVLNRRTSTDAVVLFVNPERQAEFNITNAVMSALGI